MSPTCLPDLPHNTTARSGPLRYSLCARALGGCCRQAYLQPSLGDFADHCYNFDSVERLGYWQLTMLLRYSTAVLRERCVEAAHWHAVRAAPCLALARRTW